MYLSPTTGPNIHHVFSHCARVFTYVCKTTWLWQKHTDHVLFQAPAFDKFSLGLVRQTRFNGLKQNKSLELIVTCQVTRTMCCYKSVMGLR